MSRRRTGAPDMERKEPSPGLPLSRWPACRNARTALGDVLGRALAQVAKRHRQAVGAVLAGCAAVATASYESFTLATVEETSFDALPSRVWANLIF